MGELAVVLPELKQAVEGFLEMGLSQRAAAQEIGISGTTLSQWLNGSYPGDVEGVESKVRMWVSDRIERNEAPMPQTPPWCATPTSNQIISALRYVHMALDLGVIFGGAGLGKTMTAAEYARHYNNVWTVEVTPTRSKMTAVLEEACDVAGVKGATGRPYQLSRLLQKRVEGSNGLLIVDEAQHLGRPVLEEFRRIHELAGIGLVFMGNEVIYAQMKGNARSPVFAQLFSRIGQRVQLDRPKAADVDRILEAWAIEGKEEKALCRAIAAEPTHLRGLNKAIRRACMKSNGHPPNAKQIRAAWRQLRGEE